MAGQLPEISFLRHILTYDKDAGKLHWKPRTQDMFDGSKNPIKECKRWNARYSGKEAFAINHKGYRTGYILNKRYYAHRVIWAMHYGREPMHNIDHIDGNPSNNHIDNLRDVPQSMNGLNQKMKSNNTSGVTGVSWHSRDECWYASIVKNGKSKHIGKFLNFEDAVVARKNAEKELSFHINHGVKR